MSIVGNGQAGLRSAEPLRPGGDLTGLYAAIAASSEDAVIGLTPGGTIVSWNPAAEDLFGFSEAEAVGRPVHITAGDEHRAELDDSLARIARGERVRHYETERVRKDGGRVAVSISLSPVRGPDGVVVGASEIVRDVSGRRRDEERFRESEGRLRALSDNLPDGAIYQIAQDADGRNRFTFVSAGIERLFGVTPEAALADPAALYGTVHEADRDRMLAAEAESLRTLERFDCEFRHVTPDGEVRWAHARSAPRRLPEGGVAWEGVLTDATNRKRAEEALRESEARLRRVVESNAVGLIVADFTGRLVEANDAFLATVGYTRDDLRAGRLNFLSLTPPEYRRLDEAAMAEMLRTGRHEPFEKEYVRKDGSRVPVFVGTAYLGEDGEGNNQGVGFIVDLSRQKEAERALRSSERRLRRLFEANVAGVGVADGSGSWVEANDELLRMLGCGRDELEAGEVRWKDMTPERFGPLDERAIAEAIERGACTPYEKEYVRRDGSVLPVLIGYAALEEPDRFVCFVLDLTGMRAVSDALRQSEERFRGLMDQAPFSVQILSADGRTVRVNRAWEELWGLTLDRLAGYNVLEDPQLEAKGVAPGLRRAFAGEPAELPEIAYDPEETLPGRTRNEEPTRRISAVAYPIKDAAGAVREVALVHEDVTARRKAEAGLRESEAWLRLALEAGRMGTWEWDVRTGRIRWSENLEAIHGLPRGGFDGTFEAFQALIHPDDLPALRAAIEQSLGGGTPYEADFRFVRADGGVGWMAGRGKAFHDGAGEPLRMVGVGMDVTDRKLAEEELARVTAESERRRRLYETILSNTPDLAYVWGLDHRFAYANDVLLRMWGKTWDEAIGRNCLELGYEPWHAEMHDREIDEVVATKRPVRGEVPFAGTFGRRIYDYILVPVFGADGEVEAVAGTTRDVTERKEAEERLERSEKQTRGILESITDGFIAVDADWRFTYLNAQAERIYRTTRAELLGRSYWDVFPEVAGSPFEGPYRKAMAERTPLEIEGPYDPLGGYFEVKAYPVEGGGLSFYFRDVGDRKRAEAALRASDERLRMALGAARMAVWEFDPATGRLSVMENAAQVFGLPAGEDITHGEQGFALVHPEDRGTHRARVEAAIREGGGYVASFRIVRRNDGAVRWVEERAQAVPGGPGRTDRLVGVLLDVTDRKEAEEALRESEQRTRSILESITDAFYAVGRDWRFTYLNREAERLLGRTRRDLVGRHIWEEFAPAVETAFYDAYRRAMGGTETVRFEVFYPPHEKWYEVHAYPSPDGIAVYFRDITQRREVEAALRESEERFRAIVEHSVTGVGEADLSGRFLFANDRLCEILGRPREELLAGPRLQEVTHPDDLPRNLPLFERLAREGTPFLIEKRYVRPDGSAVWVSNSVSGVRDAGGKVKSVVAVSVDVTDRKRAEEALLDADRRKDEFLAMLAHELRNPLAPIRSGLDLLRMETGDSEVVEVMSEQVGHVVRLVDDLLDVSRILRGKVELKKEPTDLTAVLRRAVEAVRPRTEEHRQRLVVALPGEPIRLDADPVRLTQVVTNLLNNASKYTDDGGEVRLEAGREAGGAVIRVSDTGIGIEPELLPRVFDLFTQADQALARSQGGLGIGLTVVRSLAEMHGGSVAAASEGLGRGSTFTVRLPVAGPGEARPAAGPHVAPSGPVRILVVDDNAPGARLLSMLLRKLGGHEVEVAHDGEAALDAAGRFRPELILLDIGLPKLDGFEVARRLRRTPATAGTLLVALTGYGTAEDRRRSEEAGFDDHLVKPPGVEMLRKVLAHPKLRRV